MVAKLSANGATVVARYTAADGWKFAVRSDGWILSKMPIKGEGWKQYLRFKDSDTALRYADNSRFGEGKWTREAA